jgi:hypothetical protein
MRPTAMETGLVENLVERLSNIRFIEGSPDV